MLRIFPDAPDSVRVSASPGRDPVAPLSFNRRALRAGTAIAALLRARTARAFVATPVDDLPPREASASLLGRIRHRQRPGKGPGPDPGQDGKRPPRLMPTGAGRHVNAMPGHAMAAGGRPLILKIPGK